MRGGRRKGPAGQEDREKTRDGEKFYSERGKETGKEIKDRNRKPDRGRHGKKISKSNRVQET